MACSKLSGPLFPESYHWKPSDVVGAEPRPHMDFHQRLSFNALTRDELVSYSSVCAKATRVLVVRLRTPFLVFEAAFIDVPHTISSVTVEVIKSGGPERKYVAVTMSADKINRIDHNVWQCDFVLTESLIGVEWDYRLFGVAIAMFAAKAMPFKPRAAPRCSLMRFNSNGSKKLGKCRPLGFPVSSLVKCDATYLAFGNYAGVAFAEVPDGTLSYHITTMRALNVKRVSLEAAKLVVERDLLFGPQAGDSVVLESLAYFASYSYYGCGMFELSVGDSWGNLARDIVGRYMLFEDFETFYLHNDASADFDDDDIRHWRELSLVDVYECVIDISSAVVDRVVTKSNFVVITDGDMGAYLRKRFDNIHYVD